MKFPGEKEWRVDSTVEGRGSGRWGGFPGDEVYFSGEKMDF